MQSTLTQGDTQRTLRFSTKVAYSVGRIAESIKVRAFETFLFFYYVQVLELSGGLAGLAVGVALVFDAVSDPFMGSISDAHRGRWGRRHPFMFLSMFPLPVAFCLLFMPPQGLGQLGMFAWLCTFAVLTRAAVTLFHVPHLALGAELSQNYYERTQIVALRAFAGILAAAAVAGIGFFHYFKATPEFPNGQMNAAQYPPFAVVCAVGMVVTIFICVVGTWSAVPHLPKAPEVLHRFSLLRVYRETFEALRNPSFRALFTGLVLIAVLGGAHGALTLHLGTYYWALTPTQLAFFIFAYMGGALLGVPLAGPLHRRFDKRATLLSMFAAAIGFTTLAPTLRLLDLLPANGDPRLLAILYPLAACTMCVTIAGGITNGSMMADVADEHELSTGRRQEGIFFGALSLSGKASSAFGHLAAGIALDVIRWPLGAGVQPEDVPPEVLWNFGLIYGPLLATFGVAALVFFARYQLSRARLDEIHRELEARRGTLPGTGPADDGAAG